MTRAPTVETVVSELQAAGRTVPELRQVRRRATAAWRAQNADFILAAARKLNERHAYRWIGYELVRFHKAAFEALTDRTLAELAVGLDSWESVDAFARTLSGPAWAQGLVSDALIEAWSRSPDRWLRRSALVSTVALNRRADGGRVEAPRTLAICRRLAGDRDDMVEKALSWALRVLATEDAAAVAGFLSDMDQRLSARVKREVGNKLRTGLKNPRRGNAT
ncbi:MAG: hypothetical protein QOI38_1168 [Sphingomonadales bacterium]|nr:hypothetical protein [Sphingomonadales bacterium]